ncbi:MULTISPECIES: hypothetical protein [unclassified Corallococcus]|uniref:hypothetical protein n=1 Tax=unclassified Corallococcus TaxID=2685029 RepID=UPI001A8E63A1|nr:MULTISPECIES: hypothetical protein [unclassified Corallococcus]MBN9681226.1 hypothetical protein [Corallococcus sp. NCSPR001]WAS87193.1 hypothetical protein O0N60_09495 [Corallococcus sp. NCRR]
MRRTRGTASLLMLGLMGLGGLSACKGGEPGADAPSAKHREGRSEVLRGLMASKEAVDPKALKTAGSEVKGEPAPAPEGTGGSGQQTRPMGWAAGRVSWVGDDELLFVDGHGQEQEVLVDEATRFKRADENVQLHDLSEGDEIRVTYEDHGQEWIARDVEAVPVVREPGPDPQSPPLR